MQSKTNAGKVCSGPVYLDCTLLEDQVSTALEI